MPPKPKKPVTPKTDDGRGATSIRNEMRLKPGPKPGAENAGRPRAMRNNIDAVRVAMWVALGHSQEAMARRLGMSRDTLRTLYDFEIEFAHQEAEEFWQHRLIVAAMKGHVGATQFVLERKFGWSAQSRVVVEDNGEDGIIFDDDKQPSEDTPDAAGDDDLI